MSQPSKESATGCKQPATTAPVQIRGTAGIREQSVTRVPVTKSGLTLVNLVEGIGEAIGKGTPSVPPSSATGSAGILTASLQ